MESMNAPRGRLRLRRTLFFGLTFLTAGGATALMLDALRRTDYGQRLIGLVLFTVCSPDRRRLLDGDRRSSLRRGQDPAALIPPGNGPATALSYGNRHAGVQRGYPARGRRTGVHVGFLLREEDQAAFDLFVSTPPIRRLPPPKKPCSAGCCRALRRRQAALPASHGSQRPQDGQHCEFVRRWGSQYDFMIVLMPTAS
jgi:hypothetical protein